MKKQSTTQTGESSPTWETLEVWIRGHVQQFQHVLEEEVTELLGRQKSVRCIGLDGSSGYRNGYGQPRRLTLGCGTSMVRRPRVRECEERLISRVLPFFKRKSTAVDHLLPELYLHGLVQGDCDLALGGLFGADAPLSSSTIARLKTHWQAEFVNWQSRSLEDLKVVYLWVDGLYVKAGLEQDKAALLVVVAALSNGPKVILAVVPGHRESTASWSAVLRDLKARGLRTPRLVIGDGHLGIWAGLRNGYPDVEEQRCWNHKSLNVLDKLPKRAQPEAKTLLCQIPYAPTCREAERRKEQFVRWCEQQGHMEAATCLERDWDRLTTFYQFPQPHWQHLRTTNPVESPFAAVRLRTDAAKRYKKVANATAVIWKLLMVAEQSFRRVKHPELMAEVYRGVEFVDGKQSKTEVAA